VSSWSSSEVLRDRDGTGALLSVAFGGRKWLGTGIGKTALSVVGLYCQRLSRQKAFLIRARLCIVPFIRKQGG